MIYKGMLNLRQLVRRSFNTTTPPFKSYYLKRPHDFHHDDHTLMLNQITMSSNIEDIKTLIRERNEDLNEVHVGYLLQNMFQRYIEFSEGSQ